VVIPTRNRHDLLERAIKSVEAQELPVHEIIVVDEASEPPVDKKAGATTIIRHSSPRGPGAARNVGAEHATGDIIAFLDDDDMWLPAKTALVSRAFEEITDAGAVFHAVAFKPPRDPTQPSLKILDEPVKRMLLARPPHPSGLAVTADLMSRVRFDEQIPGAADLDFNIRIAEMSLVVEIEEVLALHGSRPMGGSDVSIDRRIEGRLFMRQRHSKYFEDPEVSRHHEYRLGHLYRRSGQKSKALSSFSRLLLSNPFDARPWKGIAVTAVPPLSRITDR